MRPPSGIFARCASAAADAHLAPTSRAKIVELAGIEPDEIERRLATAGGQEKA
jgi:hypothetical protein